MQPLPPDGGSDSAPTPAPSDGPRLDRRQFLQLSALGAAGLAGSRLSSKKSTSRVPARARRHTAVPLPAVVDATVASGVVVPTAPWLIAENAKPGTLNWICNFVQPDHALEGYASQVSAASGDDVPLFVNTTARAVQVQAYRMGYYQGLGGRLAWQSDFVSAGPQPAPVLTPGTGTVSCPWKPTMTISVTKDWLPGCYLLKLVGSGGEEQFVPLTIRDDTSMASYVIQNSVTTWQAYNLWGDYSLYYGRTGSGGRTSPTGRASSRSTAPIRRPGPPARRTSWATSCPC